MEYIVFIALLIISVFAWLLHGATNSRLRKAEEDIENYEGVIDVRRNAEEAKHNNPDAIKRLRDKYNT